MILAVYPVSCGRKGKAIPFGGGVDVPVLFAVADVLFGRKPKADRHGRLAEVVQGRPKGPLVPAHVPTGGQACMP